MVFIQDIKERKVHWFLFPIISFCAGYLFFQNTIAQSFYYNLLFNFIFICILLTTVFLYSKLKLKTSITNTFGLGDGLLFLALVFSFSSITFIILFVGGLIFSLVMHLILKQKSKYKTVPLAGYLSLFFALVYISYWVGIINSVYIL